MDKLISLEPSNVIAIRIEPDQKCFGEMILRNVMHTMPVAFRLQPMNKTYYQVRPQSGIIPPLTAVSVEISYVLTPDSALPESFPNSDDSFILHSVVVPGAVFKDPSSTFDTVPNDCFSAKKKQVFVDSNIGVTFVGSVVLAQLVTKGLIKEVEQVLKLSDSAWHSADAVDAHGQTLLHLAIAQSRTDLVKLLLEHKPDVEARNQTGQTTLETAVAAGELLIVELLLACQASTRRSGSSKWGSIHLAVLGGHVEILKLLLLKGADIDTLTEDGCTALHLAVEERQRDCAKLLLSSGAKLDVGRAVDGETPLHLAASLGDEDMIKLLLHKGANKDILDQLGRTAYDIAAQHGHKQLFDVLRLGDSLCAAARKGEARTIQWLLQNGASVNAVDQHGWTALHRASFKGQVYTVRTLIEKGVDIDAKDKDGYTPLHCASESGQAEVIEVLVKKGADIEAKTNKGTTAQKIADTLQHTTISRILEKGGNNIDRVVHIAVPKPSVFDNSRSGEDPTIADLKKRPRRKRVHRRSFDKLRPPLAVL